MQHEEHSTHPVKGFGTNTNGVGILIVAIVAVLLALFCWNFWKDGKKEQEHYRFGSVAAPEHEGHGEAEHGEAVTEEAAAPLVNPETLGKLDTATGNFILNVGDKETITLPDSAKTILEVGANSTEARLFHFLADPVNTVDTVDKTKGWITCDRIFFETGKANLTADSKKQVHNIALILNAFPKASLKIGGYTDNTGAADVNTRLSNDRAAAILAAVKAAGTGIGNGLASEGYGPLHPIASNDTKEGQALNRRVDLRVTRK